MKHTKAAVGALVFTTLCHMSLTKEHFTDQVHA